MIVFSLLLILVAVVLLVLGLSGGSDALLIGSIVVSLLAAAALVIGARQAATMRRAALGEPTGPDPDVPPGPVGPGPSDMSDLAATPDWDPAADFDRPRPPGGGFDRRGDAFDAGDTFAGNPAESPYGPDPTFADNPPAPDEGLASPVHEKPRVASPEDAAAALAADAAYREQVARESGPAFSPAAFPAPPPPPPPPPPSSAFLAPPPASAAPPEEFGQPDDADPDDEPLPQAVRPADAVQVARMDAEVLVVDGRPRYHLPDCPHLVGKLSEGLPVAEAVELGFSPCGLCRPVDRLVAHAW